MGIFGRGKSASVGDRWTLSQGHIDGRPAITRFNTGAKSLAGSPSLGIRIGVAVPLLAPDGNGFPGGGEMDQLAAFEDAMIERAGAQAVLVGIISTRGMREFVLYTGSAEWIPQFHEDLMELLPTHEVQMVASTDSDWSVYRHFASLGAAADA